MAENLAFNIAALDNASKTFIKLAQQVEKLADKLERLDRQSAQPRVDVDTGRADRKLDTTKRKLDTLASGFSGNVIKVVAFGEALGKLAIPPAFIAAAGAIAPLMAGVASTVAAASGALLLLPAGGAAGATAFGALAVATSGVSDAIKAMLDVDTQATGASNARVSALRAVENAQRNLERTVVQGAERIADAERAVVRAQEDALDAQRDLNRARQEAAERLQDIRLQLRGAALSEEEALLAVEVAQQRLNEAIAEGDDLDIRQAELSLKRAKLTVEETQESFQDLKEEAAKAAKAGVDGDERVQAAHRRLEDATDGIADAQRNLARTQRDVAEAQVDALRQVQDAQRALESGGGVDKFAQSLAGLSDNARAFVLALQAVKPAFDEMRLDVQDQLFAGLGERVQGLAGIYLPLLGDAFGEVAASANRSLNEIADLLESRSTDFDRLSDAGAGVFDNLSRTVEPLVRAFLDIAVVGGDILKELTLGAGGAAEGFAQFIAEARESGQLEEWIRNGLDVLKAFGQFLGDVGGILAGVFRAASDGATGVLGPLSELLDGVRQWVNSFEGQEALRTFFESGSRIVKAFLPILEEVAEIIGTVIAPALADFAEAAAPGLAVFVRALGEGLRALARPGADGASALDKIGQALGDVLTALAPVLPVLGEGLAEALRILAPELDDLALAFADVLIALAPYLPELAELTVALADLLVPALENAAESLGYLLPVARVAVDGLRFFGDNLERALRIANRFADFVVERFTRFGSDVKAVFYGVVDAVHTANRWIAGALDWLVGWIGGVGGRVWTATRGIWDGLVSAFRGAVNTIIDLWNRIDFQITISIPSWVPTIGGYSWTSPDLFPDIPYLDVGGDITKTGLAMVHKGERVVPAETRALAAGGATRVEVLLRSDMSNNALANAVIATLQPVIRARGGVKVVFV